MRKENKKKRSRKRNKKNVEEYVAAEGQTDQAETNQEDGKALNSLQGNNQKSVFIKQLSTLLDT